TVPHQTDTQSDRITLSPYDTTMEMNGATVWKRHYDNIATMKMSQTIWPWSVSSLRIQLRLPTRCGGLMLPRFSSQRADKMLSRSNNVMILMRHDLTRKLRRSAGGGGSRDPGKPWRASRRALSRE